jgi:hypothetical protein
MYLVAALEIMFCCCASRVWLRRARWQQILPRFSLRGQLLTRL